MSFWVCSADASGNRLVGTEERLDPGPAAVEYPTDPAGTVAETPDGNVVVQQPSSDPRRRRWIWNTLPAYQNRYLRFINRLETLRSRTRREQGLSPYVYLREDATDGLRLWEFQSGFIGSASSNTIGDSAKNWVPDRYVNATVELLSGAGQGQRRSVITNTATTLTVSPAWDTLPSAGASYRLQASIADWLKCRVIEVSKRPAAKGGVQYEQVNLVFVIQDARWNDLG